MTTDRYKRYVSAGLRKPKDELISKFKAKKGKNFITPKILEYFTFGNNIIELSEGEGIEHEPIFGLTHRKYDKEKDEFVDLGFSRLFYDKNEAFKSANLLKETNLCTDIKTREQEKFCNEYIKDIDIPYEMEEAVPKKYPSGKEIPRDIRTRMYLKYLGEVL